MMVDSDMCAHKCGFVVSITKLGNGKQRPRLKFRYNMYSPSRKGDLGQVEFGLMCRMHDSAIQIVNRDGLHGGMNVANQYASSS